MPVSTTILTAFLSLLPGHKPIPHWIWGQGQKLPDHVWFRRDFHLSTLPKNAELTITCDDEYVLYVNGRRAASNANWYTMQDISLVPYLHKGKNVLAVASTNLQAQAGLLVRCTFQSGGHLFNLDSGLSWKSSLAPSDGWQATGYDDSNWVPPVDEGALGVAPWGFPTDDNDILASMSFNAVPKVDPIAKRKPDPASPDPAQGFIWSKQQIGPHGNFQQMPILPLHPTLKTLRGRVITSPTVIKLDFGKELAGWATCTVTSKVQPNISIYVGEASTPQPKFTTAVTKHGNSYTFTMLPTNDYTGFRYAWIHFDRVVAPVHISNLEAVYRVFPANYIGSFHCSNNLLNKIWEIGAYTVRLNLARDATGSILRPDRGDRYPWMGDDRVSHHTLFDVFGDYWLARNDFDYFVTPGAKNININGIPGYTLDWVIAMYDYYMYSGDLSSAEKHKADIKSILTDLDTTGTPPGWLFTDWEPGLNTTTDRSVMAFHIKYLQAAEAGMQLARAMHDTKDLADFRQRRNSMLAFLKESPLWVKGLGRHRLADAILAGYASSYPKSLMSDTATPYFTYFVAQALADVGQDQRALNTILKTWGRMVKLGGTSTWEFFQTPWGKVYTGNPQPPELNDMINDTISLCHPWSSGATAWLSDHVLGITPTSPGFKTCLIKPFFGNLSWAYGSVPTPKGRISVWWKKVGKKYVVKFHAPKGVKVHLVVHP